MNTPAPQAPASEAPASEAPATSEAPAKGRPRARADYASAAIAVVEGLNETFIGRTGDDKDKDGKPLSARQCAFSRAYIGALEAGIAPDIRVIVMPVVSTYKAEKVAIPIIGL